VLLYRSGSYTHPRLGVVASKKNVRTAVSRNRVKRIAREAFRSCQGALRAIDAVIVAKAGAQQVSKKQLRQCLDKLLAQLTSF
jgi:ribonuclease P protein component